MEHSYVFICVCGVQLSQVDEAGAVDDAPLPGEGVKRPLSPPSSPEVVRSKKKRRFNSESEHSSDDSDLGPQATQLLGSSSLPATKSTLAVGEMKKGLTKKGVKQAAVESKNPSLKKSPKEDQTSEEEQNGKLKGTGRAVKNESRKPKGSQGKKQKGLTRRKGAKMESESSEDEQGEDNRKRRQAVEKKGAKQGLENEREEEEEEEGGKSLVRKQHMGKLVREENRGEVENGESKESEEEESSKRKGGDKKKGAKTPVEEETSSEEEASGENCTKWKNPGAKEKKNRSRARKGGKKSTSESESSEEEEEGGDKQKRGSGKKGKKMAEEGSEDDSSPGVKKGTRKISREKSNNEECGSNGKKKGQAGKKGAKKSWETESSQGEERSEEDRERGSAGGKRGARETENERERTSSDESSEETGRVGKKAEEKSQKSDSEKGDSSDEKESDDDGKKTDVPKKDGEGASSSSSSRNSSPQPKKKASRRGEDHPAVVRLKRYIRACGAHRNYKRLLGSCRSHKERLTVLRAELQALGVKGNPSLEKCRAVKEQREEAAEMASLDVSNIISTSGTEGRREPPLSAPTLGRVVELWGGSWGGFGSPLLPSNPGPPSTLQAGPAAGLPGPLLERPTQGPALARRWTRTGRTRRLAPCLPIGPTCVALSAAMGRATE
uniref:Histone chaperone domain-containing protein n=2 Tax=Ornithorhynchus anatinus TaxID=9258 RepID=A0A6I8PJ33_ORNAN